MAAINPTFAKGRNGSLTVVAGLDDSYTFQIKTSRHKLSWSNRLENVSGFGDSGWSKYEDTIKDGRFVIAGWVLTNGNFQVSSLGAHVSTANFKLDSDTVKFVGDVKVERMELDTQYDRNVPILLAGNFHGAVTVTS